MLTHSSIDGHVFLPHYFGCCKECCCENDCTDMSLWYCFQFFWVYSQNWNRLFILFLIFWSFLYWMYHFMFPSKVHRVPVSPQPLQHNFTFHFMFRSRCPNGCEVVTDCGFIYDHLLLVHLCVFIIKMCLDFTGGSVVKNSPANARDMDSIPGPGRFHVPQGSWDLQPLKPARLGPVLQQKPLQWEACAPRAERRPLAATRESLVHSNEDSVQL